MTKAELIKALATATDMTQINAANAIDAVGDILMASLIETGSAQIPRVGTFSVRAVPGRKGRNPKTGESITISARNSVKFKMAHNLKTAVNE